MLLEFTVENYLSIKEPVTLSLVASKDEDNACNVINPEDIKKGKGILKSAVIYGANASGKSNIIKAMDFMRDFIMNKSKNILPTDTIDVTPFAFDDETPNKPSRFEVVFIQDGIKYFYGFSVDREKIHREYLYHYPKGRQAVIFERDSSNNYVGAKKKLAEMTPKNKLYLITMAQSNEDVAARVLEWFEKLYIIPFPLEICSSSLPFKNFIKNDKYASKIIDIIKKIDVGIKNITIKDLKDENFHFLEKEKQSYAKAHAAGNLLIETNHEIIKKNGTKIITSLNFNFESQGTQILFELAGFLIEAVENNKILVVDELDQSLHPELLKSIIEIFHAQNSQAQLIFTTHDTSQLNTRNFRKDQIFITEKNREEQYTDLYSLYDVKGVRTENLQKSYLQGRFGGVPFIDIEGLKWEN